MADIRKRDIEDTVWQVLAFFGFDEEDGFSEKDRYFLLDKKEAAIITGDSPKSRAEAVSACIESAFASGADSFAVNICEKSVYDLLVLFGFENILTKEESLKNGFTLVSDGIIFSEGTFNDGKTVARIDIEKLLKICKNSNITGTNNVSKNLVYAEKNAEGIAYDVCYTLRVNGCIVEMYCADGDIKTASDYAKSENVSAIVRCFADGSIEIKDMAKNEVTKTTISEFLRYYEDDEHHHGEDCSCGHCH